MSSPTTPAPRRLAYIDWMRGLAILVMIQAHALDSWTSLADRRSLPYGISAILAGFAAPMFLFLAGVSVALGAGARERRTGSMAGAAASIRRRGWEIFGLAFLFRFQAYLLNPSAMLQGLFKVDILNIMGPSIVAAAAAWQLGRRWAGRIALFGGVALLITLVTPPVRATSLIDPLPDVLEWYIRPTAGRNNFTFFPWAGFVFAGGLVGVLLERRRANEGRFHGWMLALSLLFAAACYAGSYLPSIYSNAQWWTTAPSFFLFRVGIVTAVLSAVFFYERRPRVLAGRMDWSPMALFGQSSLFVYWVHTELAYGSVTGPLHKALPFWHAVGAFVLFTVFMFGLTLAKNRAARWWTERQAAQDV